LKFPEVFLFYTAKDPPTKATYRRIDRATRFSLRTIRIVFNEISIEKVAVGVGSGVIPASARHPNNGIVSVVVLIDYNACTSRESRPRIRNHAIITNHCFVTLDSRYQCEFIG
jgi:hypothetical protein